MTDAQKIRQLERQLADLDGVSKADIHRIIDVQNDLAWMLSDTDLKRAYALSESAYSLADSPDDGGPPYQVGMAYSLRTQGYLNQRTGNYQLGLTQLLKAQEISELLALNDGLADVFDGIAGIYYQVGNFPEALSHIYKQLDAAQRIGDKRRMANAYNNLANIFFETGEYQRAVETLHHNLQIAAETDNKRIEFLSYINLAETYLLAGDYEKALENALRGLTVSQEAGFELFEVYAFEIIGKSYLKLNDASQAIHHFEKALALSRKVESKVTESLNLLNMGQVHYGIKQNDLALDYLQQSITVAQSIDAKSELFKGHLLLSEIYEQQGDFAQALYHFKKHHSFREIVHGEKADERLQILQVAHDTEAAKKEAEVFQLRTVQLEQQINERERVEGALRRARDELVTLLAYSRSITSALELKPLLELSLNLLERVVPFTAAVLLVLEEDLFKAVSYQGPPTPFDIQSLQIRVHAGSSLAQMVQTRQGFIVDDINTEIVQIQAGLSGETVSLSDLFAGIESWLGAPLLVKSNVIGLLYLVHNEPDFYHQQNLDLLQIFVNQMAATIEISRLYEQAKEAAVTGERSRMAAELHDSVTQTLFSVNLTADVLPQIWEQDPEAGRRELEGLRRLTSSALAEMRTLLVELRPEALLQSRLNQILEQMVDAWAGKAELEAVIDLDEAPRLPAEVQIAFYRIAQESINNIDKHARATRLKISLRVSPAIVENQSKPWHGAIFMHIIDNGRGFHHDQVQGSGLGLGIMNERADSIGAELAIISEIGQGTTTDLYWNTAKEAA
jgi:signal transduction histidine kinase